METGSTSQEAPRARASRPRPSPPALPCAVQLQVAAFSAGIDAINRRRDGTVNRCLYSVADRLLRVRADPRPDSSGVRSADFAVDASRGLWARVFSPAGTAAWTRPPLPLVVYFHGGGFALFSAAQCYFDRLCRRLCRVIGAVVVSVEYRLAPEHPYPAAYDDATDTLLYIDAHGVPGVDGGVTVDLSSCFLAGESAGGNIIHHAANRWAAATTATPRSVRIAGLLSVQPYFGGEERTESELRLEGVAPIVNLRRSDFWWKAFLPAGATRDHPAAHVTDENAALAAAFPPAMVVVGGFDPLQDWQRRYAGVLRRKGKAVQVVEFPEGIHAFYLFPQLADGAEVIEGMRAFVESNRTSSSSTPGSSTRAVNTGEQLIGSRERN